MLTLPPPYVRTWTAPGTAHGVALLLHGAESHAGWFDALGTRLAAGGLKVIAYDRRGWGQSPGARGRLASPPLAELAEHVDTLAPPPCAVHLVGLSWGGLLAACAREALPHMFATVTILVPPLFPRLRPSVLAVLRAGASRLVPLTLMPEDFTCIPERRAFVAADPFRTTAVGRDFCLATVAMMRTARQTCLSAPGGPMTQILLAGDDRVVDSRRTLAWARRRGANVQVLGGVQHSLVLEDPAAVAAAVLGQAAAWSAGRMTHHAS